MIRRWKKNYPLTIAKCHNPLTGEEENRLMVDGKMILRTSEIDFATKQAFEESKGAGSKKIRHRLKSVFSGVTHRNVQTSLKSLPENRTPTANTNSINFVAAKAKSRVRYRLIISLIYRISIFPKT